MPSPLRIDIEPHATPSARQIARAVEILHEGGVAAYPTDTVYALGCAIESRRGAERIYRAKRMDENKKLALICPDLSSASMYAHFSQGAFRLARRLFPGPYTLVLPASREVPRLLVDTRRKRRQVGIRIPDHPIALALVRALGRPLLTSSAIPPGEERALSDPEDVEEHFGHQVDLVIHGGPTPGEPSTVLEVEGDEVSVLRAGHGPVDGLLDG
ncbi:MAG TPA: L-threonylcarbamoyladenylate synthase [Kofleriaceae bacterium]|nr:L-threonylcarbamoyladenylate synthase [Kofleriaceae bacterium]